MNQEISVERYGRWIYYGRNERAVLYIAADPKLQTEVMVRLFNGGIESLELMKSVVIDRTDESVIISAEGLPE